MSSTIAVHGKRKHKCRSCKGKRVNFSAPVWLDDIIVDFDPCHCVKRGAVK